MKHEITLVRQQHEALGFPVRDALDPDTPTTELLGRRRAVRQQTDKLVEHGLYSNDRSALALNLGLTMTALAGSCAQLGTEPSLEDMVLAARELIEDARIPFDKGLHMKEWQQARVGIAMLEIVCHGIAALVGVPLVKVFEVLHEGFMSGAEEPDMAKINELLNGRVM